MPRKRLGIIDTFEPVIVSHTLAITLRGDRGGLAMPTDYR